MSQQLIGLTTDEVLQKQKLGLSNNVTDSYTPTYLKIYLSNIFNLINIVLTPLIIGLAFFRLYNEILAFVIFLFINTFVSILDQSRAKRTLDKLKSQFQKTVCAIRDDKETIIPASEIVIGDLLKAGEGESVMADGTIVQDNYLQLDESMLTGESNYLRKHKEEKIFSGSFIVTGNCYYIVESVGKGNFLNKLGAEAMRFKERKSNIQKDADKIITFLVVASLGLSILNGVVSTQNGVNYSSALLSITTIIALIIPQTLIFIYTLTFTISTIKLFNIGVLVQKSGSIEDLAGVDTICLDKTGTITTNEMLVRNMQLNNVNESEIKNFYSEIQHNIIGTNKTSSSILNHILKDGAEESKDSNKIIFQIPFTSKTKFSGVYRQDLKEMVFLGAPNVIFSCVDASVLEDVKSQVSEYENKGLRVVLSARFINYETLQEDFESIQDLENFKVKTNQVAVFGIEETLNEGIQEVLEDLKKQNIAIKIISGDSTKSVARILARIGIDSNQVADLSRITSEDELTNLALSKTVFTRSKPEDKLKIISALQNSGRKVAMIGDGINDVLALKKADVSIAMESGARIARDVADMVLLKNDYSKIPKIFFEGENIIFNLKLVTKIFLAKSFFACLLAIFFTIFAKTLPLLPTSTLIFSFLGSSAPGYLVVFTRQSVKKTGGFFREVLFSAIPASIAIFIVATLGYLFLDSQGIIPIYINTVLVILIVSISIGYAIYLVALAGKLKNIFFAIFVYLLIMIMAIYQTIMPILPEDSLNSRAALIALMLVGTGIILFTFRKTLSMKNIVKSLGIIFLSVVWIPIVLVFPFRSYYSVVRIDFWYFVLAFLLTIIALGILYIGKNFSSRFFA